MDLDNRFADVLATESVVEDTHDVSEGSLSLFIGDIHSTSVVVDYSVGVSPTFEP